MAVELSRKVAIPTKVQRQLWLKTWQTGLAFSQASTANVTLNLGDGSTHVAGEVNAVILELEDGTETRILGVSFDTDADAALTAMKPAFDGMTADQERFHHGSSCRRRGLHNTQTERTQS